MHAFLLAPAIRPAHPHLHPPDHQIVEVRATGRYRNVAKVVHHAAVDAVGDVDDAADVADAEEEEWRGLVGEEEGERHGVEEVWLGPVPE